MSEQTSTAMVNKPIPMRQYISFGLSNSGGCVVFSVFSSLVTIFWTDYAGMDPMIITEVVAISKIFDAISNLVFGYLIQQTKTRWGQARPWILWMSVPFGFSAVICFLAPTGSSETVQWWFAFLAYNFVGTICYTAMDLAEGTLCTLQSNDPLEREKLGAYRLGLCCIGHVLAGGLTIPLVKWMGNTQNAWITIMSVWAVYSVIVHVNCFFQCKEVPQPVIEAYVHKPPIMQQLKALLSNQYWWWCFFYWAVWATQFAIAGTSMTYYCRYILHNDNLYTIYFIAEKIVWGFFNLNFPKIRQKLGWTVRKTTTVFSILAGVCHLPLLVAPTSVPLGFVVVCLRGIGVGATSGFFNGIVGCVTDFGQYKTHQRQEALTFAAASMGEKIGNGVLLAGLTAVLAMAGFTTSTTGGAEQTETALAAIKALYIWGNCGTYMVLAFIMSLYKLEPIYPKVVAEIEARKSQGEL